MRGCRSVQSFGRPLLSHASHREVGHARGFWRGHLSHVCHATLLTAIARLLLLGMFTASSLASGVLVQCLVRFPELNVFFD